MSDVSKLEEAYRFYQKVKNDKEAIACGCYNDAMKWIFDELAELFDETKDPCLVD
ncbi:hypothetical protein [Mannheimia indoligenes]|uniref:hypothetical protein n=1 Tax=Mannheimia indoligenes TaxID=3103145 RepID=UPI002FE662AF